MSQILPGKRTLVLLLVSLSLNLFLVGGITSFMLFGLQDRREAMPPPPRMAGNHLPPPVRALTLVLDQAYPDLSDEGRKVAWEARERLLSAVFEMRPAFGQHRQELRRLLTGDQVNEAELDRLFADILAKRNQVDPILIGSVKYVAGNMDREDRVVLLNAIEMVLRRGPKGPPTPVNQGS